MNTTARELTSRLADLLSREHRALADFIAALAVFDRERRWADLEYTSLFGFLQRELGLSASAAFLRKTAAELVEQHPEVLDALKDGSLCLSTVAELSQVLTRENVGEVLPRFFHLSRREAKEITAELRPQPSPVREVVTAIRREPSPVLAPAHSPALAPHAGASDDTLPVFAQANRVDANFRTRPQEAPAPLVEPKTAALSRLHLTVSRAFLAKLDQARDALSHSHPGASADEILEAGLDLLLDRAAKRRGLVEKPRNVPPPSTTDRIPAHVRREVWKRDQGKCTWKLENGDTCGSTHRLEIDHVEPRGLGGPATVANCRLLCQGHNQRAAREAYGSAFMDLFTKRDLPPAAREPVAAWAGADGPPIAREPVAAWA